MIRCKACGYIMDEKKQAERCPACGVPRSAFEPYREPLSERRAFILGLNLHPIFLHFPQAFTVSIIPFILIGVALPPEAGAHILAAARVLGALLFPAVLAAFVFGLIDGAARFRKLATPALTRKIAAGGILLAISAAASASAVFFGTDYPGRLYLLILAAACAACEIYLAQIGKGLMCAKLPG